MSRSLRYALGALITAAALALLTQPLRYSSSLAWADNPTRAAKKAQTAAKNRIDRSKQRTDAGAVLRGPADVEAKLDTLLEPVDWDGTPLQEYLAWLSDELRLDFVLDEKALQEEGFSADAPIKLRLHHSAIPARRALDLILEPLGLAYIVDEGFVLITTQSRFEETLELRVYDCSDLIGSSQTGAGNTGQAQVPAGGFEWEGPSGTDSCEAAPGQQRASSKCTAVPKSPADCLLEIIHNATSGPWLQVDGYGGYAQVFDGLLIVWQNQRVHREIADLLEAIRKAKEAAQGSTK